MSTSNKGRREFLKKAGIGSAGLGLMLTAMGASNPAFAKMSYKYTSNHVDKVINKIKLSQPSKKSQVAFLSTVENINDLLFNEKDEGALKVFEYTQNLLKKLDPYSFGSNADGLLNLPLDLFHKSKTSHILSARR